MRKATKNDMRQKLHHIIFIVIENLFYHYEYLFSLKIKDEMILNQKYIKYKKYIFNKKELT